MLYFVKQMKIREILKIKDKIRYNEENESLKK